MEFAPLSLWGLKKILVRSENCFRNIWFIWPRRMRSLPYQPANRILYLVRHVHTPLPYKLIYRCLHIIFRVGRYQPLSNSGVVNGAGDNPTEQLSVAPRLCGFLCSPCVSLCIRDRAFLSSGFRFRFRFVLAFRESSLFALLSVIATAKIIDINIKQLKY